MPETSTPQPFAKLFDTPNGQILVTMGFDGPGNLQDSHFLTIRGAGTAGVVPQLTLTSTKANVQDEFDRYSQADADEISAQFVAAMT